MAWDLVGNLKGPQGDPGDPGVAFDDGATPTTSAVADAAATGDDTFAARRDHVHGREAFGSPSTQAFGDSPTNGVATTVPRSDHKHGIPANPVPAFGSPAASAVGDAGADGAATTLARANHVHARESFGAASGLLLKSTAANGSGASPLRADASIKAFDTTAPTTSAIGDLPAVGTVDFAARRDHVHGRERFDPPSIVLGLSATAGVSPYTIQSDSTIAAFDATSPTTQAFGDAAVVGTAAFAARRDHKHAMPTGSFSTSNPSSMDQSGALTFTVGLARLLVLGKLATYVVQVTITSVGSSGSAVRLVMPFSFNAASAQACGTFRYDRTTGATHSGIVTLHTDANRVGFLVPTLGYAGASPAFATANGDVLWFTVTGEST